MERRSDERMNGLCSFSKRGGGDISHVSGNFGTALQHGFMGLISKRYKESTKMKQKAHVLYMKEKDDGMETRITDAV